MGALLSLPLFGSVAGLGSACVSGAAFFCTGQAASALTRSCNCNSSVATRVGYSLIFLLNSLLAWLMLSDWAIRLVAQKSWKWIRMDCPADQCYGLLAVHRICFALAVFHLVLSASLVGVSDTRSRRAALQNGWWGPKVALWLLLIALSFLVPNPFFIRFWAPYIALPGSMAFILIGLVLLVDFAHTWSETCLARWEATDSAFWKWVLIGSTLGLYALTVALTVVQYLFFAGSGCGLNTTLITLNWLVSLAVSVLSIAPAVQESNPRSGLAQSGMVVAYTAYLTTSAIANHDDAAGGQCNPLQSRAAGARTGMVVLGAVFTFLAIAYSTSRAATQSKAFAPGRATTGSGSPAGRPDPHGDGYDALGTLEPGELETVIRTQPKRREHTLRYQALKAAVDEGSLPASVLTAPDLDDSDGENEDDDDAQGGRHAPGGMSPVHDDEKTGTRYNYSYFHIIFVLATMYTACLLTKSVVSTVASGESDGTPVRIGRSHVAFWMRVVSGWTCLALYGWSLAAPLVLPDRF